MDDKIVQMDVLRINRKVPKKCTCEALKFTVDTENREITCECGIIQDPFEAMAYLAKHYELINDKQKEMNEQRREWAKEKPYSVIFKNLERNYQKGTMLPSCPKCKEMFDFKDITFWSNAQFYRKLEEKLQNRLNK